MAPNILLIMADQLAPQFTGTYGHPVVQTPHMDALAARGTRFDAAYCNSPLCAPSRAAFLTGRLPTATGAYDNAADFASSLPTFAHALRAAGYATCLSGKMHFVGPDQLHGFEERLTTDVYPADFAWTPDWRDPLTRIDKWYHNMDSVTQAGPAATTFQIEFDDETTFLARRRILEYAMSGDGSEFGDGRPFAMVVGLMHPHDPYVARPEFWDLYPDANVDMPKNPRRADDPHSTRVRQGNEGDRIAASEADILSARRGYYANTSYFDHNVGILIRTLEEAGLTDNTVVIVTSDHGDMLGERDLWYKMSWFDHSSRVPLVMAGPGVRPGTWDAPCSLIDLFPTMLDIADAEHPCHIPLDGRSLWPSATERAPGQTEAIGEYCAECAPGAPVIMLRRDRWKYIHAAGDPPQLYDLAADPDELTNLAPDHPVAHDFAVEVAARWNDATVSAQVIASQDRRRVITGALGQGAPTHWDYTPPRDASQEYVRNHMDWTVAAAKNRWPPNPHLKVRS